jgi:RNA polymerase sigma-70 factor, ECF subfamily
MARKDDAWLVERLLSRDEAALRDAIAAHAGRVLSMARKVVVDHSLAEEIAQDTFLALWRRPGAFDPERGSLQSFLLGVARNKAVDRVRREEARRRATDALVEEARALENVAESQSELADVDEREAIRQALGTLSRPQREALVLAYFGGRTYREVAAELDIPEGTAKTHLRESLIKLRGALEAFREA